MTLNPSRSSVGGTLEDHLFRVRALEAERPQGVGGPVAIDLRNPTPGCYFRPRDRNFGFPGGYTLGYWHFKSGVDTYLYGIGRCPDNAQVTAVLVDVSGDGGNADVEVATYVLGDGDTWDGTIVTEPTQTLAVSTDMLTARFPELPDDLSTVAEEGQLVVVRIGHLGAGDGYGGTLLSAGAWLEVSPGES